MARESRFPVGVINIAMHAPHSPARYTQLLRRLYSLRQIVTARGVTGAVIGTLYSLDRDNPEIGLSGEFYQFIQLDPLAGRNLRRVGGADGKEHYLFMERMVVFYMMK